VDAFTALYLSIIRDNTRGRKVLNIVKNKSTKKFGKKFGEKSVVMDDEIY
jgi:hypothetical protein